MNKRRFKKATSVALIILLGFMQGCIHYGFTGASIPKGVNTIYIPFFANQASGGVPNLSQRLNNSLIDRFVNQSSLDLSDNQGGSDAVLEGSIVSYTNEPFSITGNENTNQNQVKIAIHASFKYAKKDKSEWDRTFTGSSTYDPNKDPIQGENDAAQEALDQIANNMFNDAVSGWGN